MRASNAKVFDSAYWGWILVDERIMLTSLHMDRLMSTKDGTSFHPFSNLGILFSRRKLACCLLENAYL